MPNVSTRYVFWGRAGKRRHGGTTTEPVPDAMLTNGEARVLFWSVVGAAGGPFISFTQGFPSFTAGASDITATAFCIRTVNGIPSNVACIDAFDIDSGTFLDDDFVTVRNTKNGAEDQALTLQANDYGTVPTTNNEFTFADMSLPAGGIQYWKNFVGTVTVNGVELDTTPASHDSITFAFYQMKKTSIPKVDIGALAPIIIGRFSGGIIILGPNGPEIIHWNGPDPGPELSHILAAAQQFGLAARLSPALKREALDLAAKQLATASKEVIKSANVRETKTMK